MTHLMAARRPAGQARPARDVPASGKGRNAPGGPSRPTGGRFPLTARCVAVRLRCAASRHEPRLTGGQGKAVK
jgi:hypothetical protein